MRWLNAITTTLGRLHVIGGILSIVAFMPDISEQPVLFVVLGLSLCFTEIVAGEALIKRRSHAVALALTVQGIQVFQFATDNSQFECILGPRAQVELRLPLRASLEQPVARSAYTENMHDK